MKFRNYCIVVIGDTTDILPEITKVAETKPNYLDAEGIVISTFSSVAEPRELNDYFKLNNRNFLLFDLSPDNSGYNINKKEIHEGLFGFLKLMNEDDLKQRTEDLILDIQSVSSTTITRTNKTKKKVQEIKINLKEIDKMSEDQKNKLMNELIDKGHKNLSEYEKKILNKLAI